MVISRQRDPKFGRFKTSLFGVQSVRQKVEGMSSCFLNVAAFYWAKEIDTLRVVAIAMMAARAQNPIGTLLESLHNRSTYLSRAH